MQQWLLCPGDWVEPPNQRRGGLSGVQRVQLDDGRLLYRKQQVGHLYHSWRHPLGYPTLMRERDALYDCLRLGVPVPPPSAGAVCATGRPVACLASDR